MKPTDRQKICSNCDGRISMESTECLYCGTEQTQPQASVLQPPLFKNQSLQDSLASLYTPPYSTKTNTTHDQEVKKEPEMKKFDQYLDSQAEKAAPTTILPSSVAEEETKSAFWPILMLSVGSNLLTVGLLQLLFSNEGFLRLEWQSQYWFVYCLVAIPLCYLGLKKIKSIR